MICCIFHKSTNGLIFSISNFLIWSILLIWQPCMQSAHLTATYAFCSSDRHLCSLLIWQPYMQSAHLTAMHANCSSDSHACSLSSLHILCFRRELVIRCTHINFFLSLWKLMKKLCNIVELIIHTSTMQIFCDVVLSFSHPKPKNGQEYSGSRIYGLVIYPSGQPWKTARTLLFATTLEGPWN